MKLKIGKGSGSSKDHDSTKLKKPDLSLPDVGDDGTKPFYGIRNYLHQFYASPSSEDLEGAAGWYLLPRNAPRRKGLVLCRVCTILGLVLLLAGAACIVVGYTWPRSDLQNSILRLDVETDEEGSYINRENIIKLFHDPMRPWKFIGLGVFTLGGILLAVSLLVPTCANCFGTSNFAAEFASQYESPSEPPIRIYPGVPVESTQDTDSKTPMSPMENTVPVMEEIAKVQPEAEEGEGPITGETLEAAEREAEIPAVQKDSPKQKKSKS